MRRSSRIDRTIVALAALAAACAAACAAASGVPCVPPGDPAPAAIRLAAPADGARLTAGSAARLAWNWAGTPPAGRVEEWEAFVSFDGGASFARRVTPHLDLERRDVLFDVPDVPSPDVRLLIRYGDERRETAVLLPGRFSIAPAPLPAAIGLERVADARGEAALAGGAGVVAWVEGPRDGTRGWRVALPPRPTAGRHEPALAAGGAAPPVVLPPEAPPVAPAVAEGHVPASRAVAAPVPGPAPPGAGAAERLAVVCRRNE